MRKKLAIIISIATVALAIFVVVESLPNEAQGEVMPPIEVTPPERPVEFPTDEYWEQRAEQIADEERAFRESLDEDDQDALVDEAPGSDDVVEAFLRVCISEADGALNDCLGIWQVVTNIRSRNCDRQRIRRITECDEHGETLLSALRRSQRHILGYMPLRNERARWVSQITVDCEPPENWPGNENQWDARYQRRCQNAVELGRNLLIGRLPPPRPGVHLEWLPGRPIAWGGRCETGRGSCDDDFACRRGLARVRVDSCTDRPRPNVCTYNAFWTRPPVRGYVDPVCHQRGHHDVLVSQN